MVHAINSLGILLPEKQSQPLEMLNLFLSVYLHITTQVKLSIIKHIMKTRLYNFDPLKPHFYIVKLGFTGV